MSVFDINEHVPVPLDQSDGVLLPMRKLLVSVPLNSFHQREQALLLLLAQLLFFLHDLLKLCSVMLLLFDLLLLFARLGVFEGLLKHL